LLKVVEDLKPRHLLLVFDTGKPSFRKELYPDYKANRETAPEDLVKQFPLIQEAVDALGIPRISVDGFEADDVIATLAVKAGAEGREVTIISGDKDLMQLVDGKVTL